MPCFRRLTLCITCALSFSFHAPAQDSNLGNIPIAWFEEPDQHAPHWRVHFDPPTLTYSQRLLVGVRATVSAHATERRPDWHIYFGIADESGGWSFNHDFSRVDLRSVPPDAEPLHWHGFAFVRPGTYRIALVAYDAINQRHFVWRKLMRVDRPSVLSDIDRDLPRVEFVDPDRIPPPPIPEYIPIPTHAAVRIDTIFNLTGDEQLSLTPGSNLDSFRRYSVEDGLRGATALLSQLAPLQGCLRVSAVDILRLKVVLDRSSADPSSNLNQIQQAIPSLRDSAIVDAHTLAGRTKAREFFHQFLENIVADNAACSEGLAKARRIIIVVSDSLIFPKSIDRERVSPPEDRSALVFHVRLSYTIFYTKNSFPAAVTTLDEVGNMLSALHPRSFDVVQPKDLRHAIAEIVKDIEASTTISAVR